MRSVAETFKRDDRRALRALSPAGRVALALALGRRDVEAFRAGRAPGTAVAEAVRVLERRRQAGRRASGCLTETIG